MRYACDFETTVYPGQTETEVWLAGFISEDYKEKCIVTSLTQFMAAIQSLPERSVLWFHNLKFDGSFIIDWLERNGFNFAVQQLKDGSYRLLKNSEMTNYSYKAFISSRGVWYNIVIKFRGKVITIKDSLKLLPYSLEQITKDFDTKHKKLKMEYVGRRRANGTVTAEEMEYFEHDLYALMEGLNEIWFRGFNKNTIGSCCMSEFRNGYAKWEYAAMYPNLYDMWINDINIGHYILEAYAGGFVLVEESIKCKHITERGWILDVTSLYPSLMHSKGGVEYPYGKPEYGKGRCRKRRGYYFYQRIRCEFELRDGYLPFVHIKHTYLYNNRECLKSSDILVDGHRIRNPVELTFTQTELDLFLKHYKVKGLKYVDYVCFSARKGEFDWYIDKYIKLKNNARTKADRTEAKLYLNNLYGKFAAKMDSSFKIPYLNEAKDAVSFREQEEYDANPGYIAVGAAITSEARVFTITYAQMCHERGQFLYSDTDSIHLVGQIPDGIPIAKNELCTFKIEGEFDEAFYQNAKRYIEHIVSEPMEDKPLKKPYYNITAAGLPQRGKDLFIYSIGGKTKEDLEKDKELTSEELDFISVKRKITDFDKGIVIPGKLRVKRMKGGIVLEPTTFSIR